MLDVNGVGYLVYCSDRTLAVLPPAGEAVALYTDLLVREDLLQLFGFTSLIEKEWHRLLMSVQGIGAKASLSILGALGPDGVSRAIALGDWTVLKAAKGVGPKTAQRVVIELKDKAPGVMAMIGRAPQINDPGKLIEDDVPTQRPELAPSVQADALSALRNLGYAPGDAAAAVVEVLDAQPGADTSALIRASLKILAPKSL
jgi:Holliday junction DNA helicase RuvA